MSYPYTFQFRSAVSQTIAFNQSFLSNNKNHKNASLTNNIYQIRYPIIQQKRRLKYCKHQKWTINEDIILCRLIKEFGENNWSLISEKMDGRNQRQCKDRWNNYLNPNLKVGDWTQEEDDLILKKREELGPKWKIIATFFKNRTDSMIKTRYNALIRFQIKKNFKNYVDFISKQSKQMPKCKKSKHSKDSISIDNMLLDSTDSMFNKEFSDDEFFNFYDE